MEKQKPKKNIVSDVTPKQLSKETTEQMVRSLQGVFCKGRYRSWTFGQSKKTE
jgi:hypothetical protein